MAEEFVPYVHSQEIQVNTRRPRGQLIRWNTELDQSLPLFIVSVCRRNGIRIPFDQVAQAIGGAFTEGAIVQHIEKLRRKLEELNVVPVPPAPRRSDGLQSRAGIYGKQGKVYNNSERESTVREASSGTVEEENAQQGKGFSTISGDSKSSTYVREKATHRKRKGSKRKASEIDTNEMNPIEVSDDEVDPVVKMQYESADEEIDRALGVGQVRDNASGFGANEYTGTGSSRAFPSGTRSDERNNIPEQPPPVSAGKRFRRVRLMQLEEEWSEHVFGSQ